MAEKGKTVDQIVDVLSKLNIRQYKSVASVSTTMSDLNDELSLYSSVDLRKSEKPSEHCLDSDNNYFISSSMMTPTSHSSPKQFKKKPASKKRSDENKLVKKRSSIEKHRNGSSNSDVLNENIDQFYLNLDSTSLDLGNFCVKL
jgi:hypothetical protein